MRHRGLLTAAIVLIAVGVAGFGVVAGIGSLFPVPAGGSASAALGRQIYLSGADDSGPIPRTFPGGGLTGLGMMAGGCVDCHGADGRGGRIVTMMGSVSIPDIRYSTLTTPHADESTSSPAWSDADIARAIVDGVDPGGQQLSAPMPRWDMTGADAQAVIDYLKELSAR